MRQRGGAATGGVTSALARGARRRGAVRSDRRPARRPAAAPTADPPPIRASASTIDGASPVVAVRLPCRSRTRPSCGRRSSLDVTGRPRTGCGTALELLIRGRWSRDRSAARADRCRWRGQDAWVEVGGARGDLRAGYGRLVWGRLDEIQPSDVINPLDTARFLLDGRSAARLPVDVRSRPGAAVGAADHRRRARARCSAAARSTRSTSRRRRSISSATSCCRPASRCARSDIERIGRRRRPGRMSRAADACRRRSDASTSPARCIAASRGSASCTFVPKFSPVRVAASSRRRRRLRRGRRPARRAAFRASRWSPATSRRCGRVGDSRRAGGVRREAVRRRHAARPGRWPRARRRRRLRSPHRRLSRLRIGARAPRVVRATIPAIARTDVSLVGSIDRTFARDRYLARAFAVVNPGDGSGFVRGLLVWTARDNVAVEASAGGVSRHRRRHDQPLPRPRLCVRAAAVQF